MSAYGTKRTVAEDEFDGSERPLYPRKRTLGKPLVEGPLSTQSGRSRELEILENVPLTCTNKNPAIKTGVHEKEIARPTCSYTCTVDLPEGLSYTDLHQPLKEQGYLIYKSQGHLSETTFRLGTVGVISQDDVQGFLGALGRLL